MWKWLLKQAIKALAEPITDATIDALKKLAKSTETNIDNTIVAKIEEYRDAIIGFILGNIDSIVKKA